MIDQHKMHDLRDHLRVEIRRMEKEALTLLPNKIRIKHRDKIDDQLANGKSPFTGSVLQDFFFTPMGLNLKPKMTTPKTGAPSMARGHLRMFAHNPAAAKFVGLSEEMNGASKTLSTFVEGFLKHLRPDGCLHPSYMLFHGAYNDDEDNESGTVSGRLAAKDPAIQTLPKKTKWTKRLRECYVARPGKVFLSIDYSQGELRVVACVAPEQTMINSYLKGLDLHAVTGAQLASVPLDEFLKWKDSPDKELAEKFDLNRAKAKPANFGLLYGMGPEGFQAYAWANYGLKLSLDEATAMRDAFFTLYPGLTGYHDNMRAFVKMHEHVRSPLGRIRHLPTIRAWDKEVKSRTERQAINSPIQATLTDMMIWAIALIEDAYPNDEFNIVAMIHDAFIAEVDIDKVELRMAQARQIMEHLPFKDFGWKPQLSFPVDGEFGANLAQMSKIKVAA